MTCTLIILAHPDPKSFNHAWAKATADAEKSLGHQVITSDLYAMGFDPLLQDTATPKDDIIKEEVDKIHRADRIIFHFPIWWFAPPAILKGWFDRALVHPDLHTIERRFDTGICKTKKALFCATTGAPQSECGPDGKEGDLSMHLWPAAYALRYCGFTVLEPVTVHDVVPRDDTPQRLAKVLADQQNLSQQFDDLAEITFNPDTDFDDAGHLKPEAPSHSAFIRHDKKES